MHCNLRPSDAAPGLIRFNYDAHNAKFKVAEPIGCHLIAFLLLILYVVTLTFDLEHFLCIACDLMKLCTKYELNRTICDRVIAI